MPNNLREKVRKVIEQRGLCSYMNTTKWKELCNSMIEEMPFPPPFIIKDLFDEKCDEEQSFQQDVWYWGDWEFDDSSDDFYISIEWIKIRPRYLKGRGSLIKPNIISAENELVHLLDKYNIPFVENDGVYCIYGYR